jgi:hypothetical protein
MAGIAWAKYPDPDDVWGRHRVTFWTMTLSGTTYTAGGYAVSGATFGIKSILGMQLIDNTVLAGTSSTLVPQYNATTGKLQLFGTGAADFAVLDEYSGSALTMTALFLIISISD